MPGPLQRLAEALMTATLGQYWFAYRAYFLLLLPLGTLLIWVIEYGSDMALSVVDALYVSVSAVSMTGLTPVPISDMKLGSQLVIVVLLLFASPIVMSLVPVCTRLYFLRQSQQEAEKGGDSDHKEEIARRSQLKDDILDSELLAVAVAAYYVLVQAVGATFLWIFLIVPGPAEQSGPIHANDVWSRVGAYWASIFISITTFHNAGFFFTPTVPVLITIMFLLMAGNTWYPIFLRMELKIAAWLLRSSGRSRFAIAIERILDHPHRYYYMLFPRNTTWLLALTQCVIIAVQVVALYLDEAVWAASGRTTAMTDGMDPGRRFLAILFVSVSSRTCGLSFLDLALLSPSSALVLCLAMWISSCPVVLAERARSEYSDDADSLPKVLGWRQGSMTQQVSDFMCKDMSLLVVILFFIFLIEEHRQDSQGNFFLFTLFEFCSAYGTSGLTMVSTEVAYSAQWLDGSKLLLMLIMMLGRFRGLPFSIRTQLDKLDAAGPDQGRLGEEKALKDIRIEAPRDVELELLATLRKYPGIHYSSQPLLKQTETQVINFDVQEWQEECQEKIPEGEVVRTTIPARSLNGSKSEKCYLTCIRLPFL